MKELLLDRLSSDDLETAAYANAILVTEYHFKCLALDSSGSPDAMLHSELCLRLPL